MGDVHGCVRELKILWTHILEKASFDNDIDRIIFLGDYIDRGPASKEVVDFCIELQKTVKNTIFLKGNHEDMFLSYMGENGLHGDYFLQNGGDKTLKSYGHSNYKPYRGSTSMIPANHLEFFKTLKNYHMEEKYIFIHAGVEPKTDIHSQEISNFFWQRERFYDMIEFYHKDFGNRCFIHGHTPTGVEFRLPYRINLDSGCVFGSLGLKDGYVCALSCMELNVENPINSTVYQLPYGGTQVEIIDNSIFSWPV
jgi:serine/threonine protein phosphatase 1